MTISVVAPTVTTPVEQACHLDVPHPTWQKAVIALASGKPVFSQWLIRVRRVSTTFVPDHEKVGFLGLPSSVGHAAQQGVV